MKNNLKRIIAAVLLCFILLAHLYACSPKDEDNTANTDNNNNGGADNTGADGGSNAPNTANLPANSSFTSKEIADAIMVVFPAEELPEGTVMTPRFSGADENSDEFLEPERAGFLTDGKLTVPEELTYIEDYAFYHSAGLNLFEVSVMRVKQGEEENNGQVIELLNRRIQRKNASDWRLYVEVEAPLLENAKIVTAGNYVILLVTTDNKRAEDVISAMVYGEAGINLDVSGSANADEEQDGPQVQVIENSPGLAVSMEEVVNIEPEILFDFDILASIEFPAQTQGETGARRTAMPQVKANHHSHNTSFLLGGKCEIGAMIRVTGGTEEIYTGSDHGDFLVEVPFAAEGTSILRLTAEAPGKEPSEEIAFVVKARRDISYYEDFGTFGVIVGYNYKSFFHDCLPSFIGEDLLTEAEITNLTQRTARRIDDLRSRDCDAEIIYLLVPNTMVIYSEDVPKRYTQKTGETLLSQWKRGLQAGGATVIDLTDLMMAHKNDEYKIWQYTDSHWSEYGAYIGYTELMKHIARKFPDAAPRPRSDFEFYYQEVTIGDIHSRLALEDIDLKENATFARFNFDPPHFNPEFNKGHLGMDLYRRPRSYIIHDRVGFRHTTNTNLTGLELPSAYVMRDSFEGPLHAFYTDRFSTATFAAMWDYSFNMNDIVRLNPDYVICVISERNIKSVIYN